MTEGFEAFYLSSRARGEASAWVSLFSKSQGLISAYCRGAKSPKKAALLQPFTPLWVELKQKSDSFFIETLENIGRPLFLGGRVLISCLYLNELLTLFLPEQEPHVLLFDVYQTTLLSLEQTKTKADLERLLRQFECFLLKECGYELLWEHDALGQEILPTRSYLYKPGQELEPQDHAIPGRVFLDIMQGDFSLEAQSAYLKKIFRQTIAYHLNGKSLKTRDLFSSISPGNVDL